MDEADPAPSARVSDNADPFPSPIPQLDKAALALLGYENDTIWDNAPIEESSQSLWGEYAVKSAHPVEGHEKPKGGVRKTGWYRNLYGKQGCDSWKHNSIPNLSTWRSPKWTHVIFDCQ